MKNKNVFGVDRLDNEEIKVSENPKWLETIVPPEYEDEGLFEIILFFVIHSPCQGQSASGISLTDRGWKPRPWSSPKYLKEKLDKAIFGDEQKMLKMVEGPAKIAAELDSFQLGEDFHMHRVSQRAIFTKSSNTGCQNEYMSLFYHLRNALAHGRIAMFSAKNDDVTFVMEDKNQKNNLTARIIINKSSLLRIIDVLKNPPPENDNDNEEDIAKDMLFAIKEGLCTKKQLLQELDIDDSTYNRGIEKLKSAGKIEFSNKKWQIIDNNS